MTSTTNRESGDGHHVIREQTKQEQEQSVMNAPDEIVTIKVVGMIDDRYVIKVPGILQAKRCAKQTLGILQNLGFNVVNDPDLYTI
jgi:methylmalonyl-CoA mutase cobalamin-binding subunit